MNRKILVSILLLLILLFLVVYLIFFASADKIFNIKPQKYLEDESVIQDTIICDPLTSSLQSCSVLGDPCIQCENSLYSCQDSDGTLNITSEDNKSRVIPQGRWCLPAQVESAHSCNLATSTPILTRYGNGLYKWRCYCKYPNWIAPSSINGDCSEQIACNHLENPSQNYLVYCKDQGAYSFDEKTGKYTCSDGSEPIKWDPKDQIDLEKHSFCHCADGYLYNEDLNLQVKECIKNPCGEGKVSINSDGSLSCIDCPKGQISCTQLPSNKSDECSIGCIPDPCLPNGTYSEEDGGKCICDCKEKGVNGQCIKGYMYIQDKNFLANGYCAPVNDACNLIGDDCSEYRGGRCITCPVSAGYGDVKVYVPYCGDCSWDKG